MFKVRPFSFLREIFSNTGRELISAAEKEIEEDETDSYIESSSSNLFGGPTNIPSNKDELRIFEHEQLKMIKTLYNRAKHSLENGLYDPANLTIAESIIFNRAEITFSGYYKDYIFSSYSKGVLYLVGPRNKVTLTPDGEFVSLDPTHMPFRNIDLIDMSGYLKIKCQFPINCLADLAMHSDYFADLGYDLTLEKMRVLSKTL